MLSPGCVLFNRTVSIFIFAAFPDQYPYRESNQGSDDQYHPLPRRIDLTFCTRVDPYFPTSWNKMPASLRSFDSLEEISNNIVHHACIINH
mmetsp:Transcript_22477/g.53287  ORF Transcript_22477/g.53287 Transcript_22477/m.53287 type:complete len:91 (+) Transcript_22477:3-275(+)